MSDIVPDLRYPIGKFKKAEVVTNDVLNQCIRHIEATPAKLRAAVSGLTEAQLETPYREGGWTVKQVVHHLADSHLNAYIRFRLALTEDVPKLKTYKENLWAELIDARTARLETSLNLLEALHERWIILLKSLKPEDFKRTMDHPENGIIVLENLLQIYGWHGQHHTAHITGLRERMGW